MKNEVITPAVVQEQPKEFRGLKTVERDVVHNIVDLGMDYAEAYATANGFSDFMEEDANKRYHRLCTALIQRPAVLDYFNTLQKQADEYMAKKSAWTKELATQKLLKLVEHIEKDVYEEGGKLTLTKVQGILQPIKELNLMNGFNELNLNNNQGLTIKFVQEDQLED